MPLSSFQPKNYAQLLQEKVVRTLALLQRFDPPAPTVYPSKPDSFRMRAEFRMWHDGDDLNYVMFKRGDPKTPYVIKHFPIACDAIQAAMPHLRALLTANSLLRGKLFQVEFLASLTGEIVITLAYHRKLDEDWIAQATMLRESLVSRLQGSLQTEAKKVSIIGRSRKQKLVLGNDFVLEALTVAGHTYQYQQFEQAFTQPNAEVNIAMLEWAGRCAGEFGGGDLLELYCGNGNFTLPLAPHFDHVIATEVAKSSTKAAHANIIKNKADNVHLIRLSAEEVTQALRRDRDFRRLQALPKPLHEFNLKSLFVDPPRAGLDQQTTAMAAGFENIMYISCNPQTLATNLGSLADSHRIEHFALFDQFPYTEHMECGMTLRRVDRSDHSAVASA